MLGAHPTPLRGEKKTVPTNEEALEEIREELIKLRELLVAPTRERPDDLVDASYIAARTNLAVRTILQGKAGTKSIPRVVLKDENGTKGLIRFPRASVDRWIRNLAEKAIASNPSQRANTTWANFRRGKRKTA